MLRAGDAVSRGSVGRAAIPVKEDEDRIVVVERRVGLPPSPAFPLLRGTGPAEAVTACIKA